VFYYPGSKATFINVSPVLPLGVSVAGKATKTTKSAKSEFSFKSTRDIDVSKTIIDQVIGQEEAVKIVKKASKQRRHVLLIGEPGTGKSMLGLALAELLPKEKLVDLLAFANPNDENQPLIRAIKAGQGRRSCAQGQDGRYRDV
jgi:Lon-like ATP-dependent protease